MYRSTLLVQLSIKSYLRMHPIYFLKTVTRWFYLASSRLSLSSEITQAYKMIAYTSAHLDTTSNVTQFVYN